MALLSELEGRGVRVDRNDCLRVVDVAPGHFGVVAVLVLDSGLVWVLIPVLVVDVAEYNCEEHEQEHGSSTRAEEECPIRSQTDIVSFGRSYSKQS